MGAVAQFMTFGVAMVATAVALRSLDRLLYSLDATRDERVKLKELEHRARIEQQRMLAEGAAASA